MGRLLVHIATGPENVTRAALGLLVARTALESGHQVDVFLAGDGVGLMRPETLDAGAGIGTGSMREHVDALVAGGATFYLSGMSSKARGVSADAVGRRSRSRSRLRPASSSSRSRRIASSATDGCLRPLGRRRLRRRRTGHRGRRRSGRGAVATRRSRASGSARARPSGSGSGTGCRRRPPSG